MLVLQAAYVLRQQRAMVHKRKSREGGVSSRQLGLPNCRAVNGHVCEFAVKLCRVEATSDVRLPRWLALVLEHVVEIDAPKERVLLQQFSVFWTCA